MKVELVFDASTPNAFRYRELQRLRRGQGEFFGPDGRLYLSRSLFSDPTLAPARLTVEITIGGETVEVPPESGEVPPDVRV